MAFAKGMVEQGVGFRGDENGDAVETGEEELGDLLLEVRRDEEGEGADVKNGGRLRQAGEEEDGDGIGVEREGGDTGRRDRWGNAEWETMGNDDPAS